MENYDAGQTVKLSCRNVWKIYGDTSDSFFMDRNGNVDDPQAHVKKILTVNTSLQMLMLALTFMREKFSL